MVLSIPLIFVAFFVYYLDRRVYGFDIIAKSCSVNTDILF